MQDTEASILSNPLNLQMKLGLEEGRGSPEVHRELVSRPGSVAPTLLISSPELLCSLLWGQKALPSVPNSAEDLKTLELAGKGLLTSCLWVVAIPEAAASAF